MDIYGIHNPPGDFLELAILRTDGWVRLEYWPKSTNKIKSLDGLDMNSIFLIRRTLIFDSTTTYTLGNIKYTCSQCPFLKEDLEGGFFDVERWVDNWTSIV